MKWYLTHIHALRDTFYAQAWTKTQNRQAEQEVHFSIIFFFNYLSLLDCASSSLLCPRPSSYPFLPSQSYKTLNASLLQFEDVNKHSNSIQRPLCQTCYAPKLISPFSCHGEKRAKKRGNEEKRRGSNALHLSQSDCEVKFC